MTYEESFSNQFIHLNKIKEAVQTINSAIEELHETEERISTAETLERDRVKSKINLLRKSKEPLVEYYNNSAKLLNKNIEEANRWYGQPIPNFYPIFTL